MKTKEKLGLLLVIIVFIICCAIDNTDSSTKKETIDNAKIQAEINQLSN